MSYDYHIIIGSTTPKQLGDRVKITGRKHSEWAMAVIVAVSNFEEWKTQGMTPEPGDDKHYFYKVVTD